MDTTGRKPSSVRLAEANPGAMALYKQMRERVMAAPGVEAATCEVVLAMQLAVRGQEAPFKVHALRALAQGVPLQQLQGLLMAGLGVTLIACEAARALEWLEEAHAESVRP